MTGQRGLVTEMTHVLDQLSKADDALRLARDAEVDAKHEHESTRRRALLSDERPRVTRDGYTVAERDAWVDDQAADAERAYDLAVARRKAAEDHLRTLRDQSSLLMAIAKARQAEMNLTGRATP